MLIPATIHSLDDLKKTLTHVKQDPDTLDEATKRIILKYAQQHDGKVTFTGDGTWYVPPNERTEEYLNYLRAEEVITRTAVLGALREHAFFAIQNQANTGYDNLHVVVPYDFAGTEKFYRGEPSSLRFKISPSPHNPLGAALIIGLKERQYDILAQDMAFAVVNSGVPAQFSFTSRPDDLNTTNCAEFSVNALRNVGVMGLPDISLLPDRQTQGVTALDAVKIPSDIRDRSITVSRQDLQTALGRLQEEQPPLDHLHAADALFYLISRMARDQKCIQGSEVVQYNNIRIQDLFRNPYSVPSAVSTAELILRQVSLCGDNPVIAIDASAIRNAMVEILGASEGNGFIKHEPDFTVARLEKLLFDLGWSIKLGKLTTHEVQGSATRIETLGQSKTGSRNAGI